MTKFGYARVSSVSQSLEDQTEQLTKAGCTMIRAEKQSGKTFEGREELKTLLAFVREGDEVVVTRIDRLARSVRDLCNIVAELRNKGVNLIALHQSIDTGSPAGMAFLQMLGVFAEFERALILDRQKAGIAAARAAGLPLGGRKPVIPREDVARLKAENVGAAEIARRLKIGPASVYRILHELERKGQTPCQTLATPSSPPSESSSSSAE